MSYIFLEMRDGFLMKFFLTVWLVLDFEVRIWSNVYIKVWGVFYSEYS